MLDTRMTGHRKGLRWWECSRCGNNYSEDCVVIQRGIVICKGPNTNGCFDEYGYQYHFSQMEIPYETVPEDPPLTDWEDL